MNATASRDLRSNAARCVIPLSGAMLLATVLVSVRFAPSLITPSVLERSNRIAAWRHIEDFRQPLAQFESVFWEPRDTESLRQLIRETRLVQGKTVLEIGTGTGLIALCCLQAGAMSVVATDVNPAALANARSNARMLGLDDRLETRLVALDQPEAYSVLYPGEQFDLIISNPPWEDQRPNTIDEFALYDLRFRLLDSFVQGLELRLKSGGRLLLVYGSRQAITRLQNLANQREMEVVLHDDRSLDQLPEVFLPGMLIELRP